MAKTAAKKPATVSKAQLSRRISALEKKTVCVEAALNEMALSLTEIKRAIDDKASQMVNLAQLITTIGQNLAIEMQPLKELKNEVLGLANLFEQRFPEQPVRVRKDALRSRLSEIGAGPRVPVDTGAAKALSKS